MYLMFCLLLHFPPPTLVQIISFSDKVYLLFLPLYRDLKNSALPLLDVYLLTSDSQGLCFFVYIRGVKCSLFWLCLNRTALQASMVLLFLSLLAWRQPIELYRAPWKSAGQLTFKAIRLITPYSVAYFTQLVLTAPVQIAWRLGAKSM